jgi:isopentenyl-diphosphate delta-isomerase
MDNDDELLDLVDENDRVIDTILRSQTNNLHEQDRGFLRAAEVLLRNQNGQLWIPRRQMHKRIAPGRLDYSTSGHVASGESYIDAAIREVKEELNLDIMPDSLKLLYKLKRFQKIDLASCQN